MKKIIYIILALAMSACETPVTVDIETTLSNGTLDTITGIRADDLRQIWMENGCVIVNSRSVACGVYKYRIISKKP